MEYDSQYIDCFQWVHENEEEKVIFLINQIINYVQKTHIGVNSVKKEHEYLLKNYHNQKVIKNIEFAQKSASNLINLNRFSLNEINYSINDLNFLSDYKNFSDIISFREQQEVHGDLTLDNILVKNENDFKLIDPNPHKGFSNELIDWAKLMQSIHSGYEFIYTPNFLSIESSNILCIAPTSNTYKLIHKTFESFLVEKYGIAGLKQVYLHEIVHFLRLLPYKFATNSNMGLYFLAHTCKLTREFQEKN